MASAHQMLSMSSTCSKKQAMEFCSQSIHAESALQQMGNTKLSGRYFIILLADHLGRDAHPEGLIRCI